MKFKTRLLTLGAADGDVVIHMLHWSPFQQSPWMSETDLLQQVPIGFTFVFFGTVLYPCYTYTRPQYDLTVPAERRENGVVVVATYWDLFTNAMDELGRVWSRWPLKNFEPTQKIWKAISSWNKT